MLSVATGVLVAGGSYKLLSSYSTKYVVAAGIAVAMAAAAAYFAKHFFDFVFITFFVTVPVTGFVKSFFILTWDFDDRMRSIIRTSSGIIGIGLTDLLLTTLYAIWAYRVFVTKAAPRPRPQKSDFLPLLLIAAYVLSIPGTTELRPPVFATYFLLRYVAVYFFVSRHFHKRHFPWLAAALAVVVVAESGLGIFQYLTGKLTGLAMAGGFGENVDNQYLVPGIEHLNRATGTAFESHAFGLAMAMLAQFAFVLALSRRLPTRIRFLFGAVLLLAVIAVFLSFARSSWLSCAIALFIGWCVHLAWGEREVLTPTFLLTLVLLILSPWIAPLVVERFSSSTGLLSSRFDQYPVAWAIWRDNFVFGFGVGNYMDALLNGYDNGSLPLPVHNVFLWVAAESGIVGVIAFFGIALTALRRAWKLLRSRSETIRRFALAIFMAITAYLLDGLTNPVYREPMAYLIYWICIALSVALVRLDRLPRPDRAAAAA